MLRNNLSIAIVGLARNCDTNLSINIKLIEELRKNFIHSEVLIVENDSIDRTKSILFDWKEKSKLINLVSFDSNELTIPVKSDQNPYPMTSMHRIERLSKYRNIYIDWLRENSRFDVCIVIDLDIKGFSINGIMKSLNSTPSDWGAIFSNGQSGIKFFNKIIFPMYYDMFSFVDYTSTIFDNNTTAYLSAKRKNLVKQIKSNLFISVKSSFGGLALYKYDAISDLRYTALQNHDEYIKAVCEHVPFNLRIIEKGFNNYISSEMKVFYGVWKVPEYLRFILPSFLFEFLASIYKIVRH